MKKNIIKFISVIGLVILINMFTINVYAAEKEAENSVKAFLSYVDNGGSNYAIKYIDSSNNELYNTFKNRINSFSSVKYEVTKVTQQDNLYKVDVRIKAEGDNWKIEGITAHFDVKYDNGSYKITNTDFFEITSPEHIAGMAISIVAIVFIVLGIIFVGIVIIIVVIIIIVVNISKKK